MHRRAVRIALLTLMLAGGLASGLFLYNIDNRETALRRTEARTDARVAQLTATLMEVAAAQHASVTLGQQAEPWFERITTLVRQLYDGVAALREGLRSPEALASVDAIAAGVEALVAADLRIRENLRLGQPLMAADVIFSDSRNSLDMMASRLRELRDTEARAADRTLAALRRERWSALGGVGLLWMVGALLLYPTRTADVPPEQAAAPVAVVEHPVRRSIDLPAAAALCTDISRVTTAAALPALLERAAALLDAPGVILWMAAGEELFAVTSHGYSPHVMKKVGPIARRADNATASAWRRGRTTTVGGTTNGNGAIVTPLFGPDSCIGVLAAEVRSGRERDEDTQAVAAMVAAQLATVVSAWPGPSAGDVRAEASA
jgi:hypothetical protein